MYQGAEKGDDKVKRAGLVEAARNRRSESARSTAKNNKQAQKRG